MPCVGRYAAPCRIKGIDTFIEVGPGKHCPGLVKRTLSDVRVYSCETAEQVAAIADELA